MVWGGLPLVAVLIWLVPDALFATEELDAVLSRGDLKTARIKILSNVMPSMRAAAARIEY